MRGFWLVLLLVAGCVEPIAEPAPEPDLPAPQSTMRVIAEPVAAACPDGRDQYRACSDVGARYGLTNCCKIASFDPDWFIVELTASPSGSANLIDLPVPDSARRSGVGMDPGYAMDLVFLGDPDGISQLFISSIGPDGDSVVVSRPTLAGPTWTQANGQLEAQYSNTMAPALRGELASASIAQDWTWLLVGAHAEEATRFAVLLKFVDDDDPPSEREAIIAEGIGQQLTAGAFVDGAFAGSFREDRFAQNSWSRAWTSGVELVDQIDPHVPIVNLTLSSELADESYFMAMNYFGLTTPGKHFWRLTTTGENAQNLADEGPARYPSVVDVVLIEEGAGPVSINLDLTYGGGQSVYDVYWIFMSDELSNWISSPVTPKTVVTH